MANDDATRDAVSGKQDGSHDHGDADEGDGHGEHGDDHGERSDDHGEHGEGHADDRRAYDPHKIDLPGREPPLRSTAPQSDFATTQVVRGAVVLVIGLALTFGLGIVLA